MIGNESEDVRLQYGMLVHAEIVKWFKDRNMLRFADYDTRLQPRLSLAQTDLITYFWFYDRRFLTEFILRFGDYIVD